MEKPGRRILDYAIKEGHELPLNVLRQFQEFEKSVHSEMKSYDRLPAPAAYGMRCFSKLRMLGMALAMSGDYPAAERCLSEIMTEFNGDSAFTDGITLFSWFLFNFPISPNGPTIADEVLKQRPDLAGELGSFIAEGIQSRFGLYEVVRRTSNGCKLKELFTDQEVVLNQSLETPNGNVALIRVMKLLDGHWAFGDTNEFPAEYVSTLKDMVESKMDLYFPIHDTKKSFESMMKLAGPYWFSIIARDYQGDILNPDHYLSYYK